MRMQVQPLTPFLGLEVTGVDLAGLLPEPVKQELYQMFADNAVLVFRDQEFDAPQFATAARLFGEIIPEQFPNYRLPEFPTVSFLSNRDLEQTGKLLGRANQKPAVDRFQMHAIVGDKPRKRQQAGSPRLNEFVSEP